MAQVPHILCSGGAWYIGSHIVVKLLESGFRVSVMDNFMNSSEKVKDRLTEITGVDVPFNVDMCDEAGGASLFSAKPIWYSKTTLQEQCLQPLRGTD